MRKENLMLDRMVDEKVVELLNNEKWIIIETLTAPIMLKNYKCETLKIYFDIELTTRVKRAYISSDTISLNDLQLKINDKDSVSRDIIKNLRWFDIFDEELMYDNNDIIIDNSTHDEIYDKNIIEKEKKLHLDLLIACVLVARKEMRWHNIPDQDYNQAKVFIEKNSKLVKKINF